jgi:hypothetical protein
MRSKARSRPLTADQVIASYFLEHRAKLVDIAAFLDRLDRAKGGAKPQDFRLVALHRALAVLSQRRPGRAQRVLEVFSDPTTAPIPSAAGMKGASGAWPGAAKAKAKTGRARR